MLQREERREGRRVGDLTRKGRVEGDDAVAEKGCKRIVYSWLQRLIQEESMDPKVKAPNYR
jgi:hypothetical protein